MKKPEVIGDTLQNVCYKKKRRGKKKKGYYEEKVEVQIKEAEKSEQWWFDFNVFTITEKVDLILKIFRNKFISINIEMNHFNASNN